MISAAQPPNAQTTNKSQLKCQIEMNRTVCQAEYLKTDAVNGTGERCDYRPNPPTFGSINLSIPYLPLPVQIPCLLPCTILLFTSLTAIFATVASALVTPGTDMSTYAHAPSGGRQLAITPPLAPDRSALDLLSRVALAHPSPYPTPSPPPYAVATKRESLPQIGFQPPAFPLSFPPSFPPDLSPVSSDDGDSLRVPPSPCSPLSRPRKVSRVTRLQPPSKARSQPSRFCHICSRTSKKVGLVACGNFATGACRKVVCHKCFNDHKWDWQEALAMGGSWICTHCREACPDRAQCAIYKRTNERRREQQQQQKSHRSEAMTVVRGGHGRFMNKDRA